MLPRLALVILLALVVGFGVSRVAEQGSTARQASQAGAQLDAALDNAQGSVATPRWYDNPSTIGLMAGGAVFVVGVIAAVAIKPPMLPASGERRD